MIYVFLYALFLLSSFIEICKPSRTILLEKNNKKRINIKNLHFILLVLILLLISGTRYYVGTDYMSYLGEYERTRFSLSKIENIFQIFLLDYPQEPTLYIIYWLSNTFNYAILFYAIISIVPKAIVLKKNVGYPIMGMFIYFLDFYLGCDMGVIRQCAAMSVILWSFTYIKRKNIKGYIICIIIAFLFHKSALLFAPAYLVNYFDLSPKKMSLIATISVAFSKIDFSSIINSVLEYIPDFLLGKYALRTFEMESVNFGITTLYRIVLFWIFSFIIAKILNSNVLNNDNKRVVYISYKIMFLGTCGFYIFRSVYSISGRGMYYYFIFEIILISLLLMSLKSAKERLLFFALSSILYSILYFSTLINYSNITYNGYSAPYFPYTSFLFS